MKEIIEGFRHFLGGFGLGFTFALLTFEANEYKLWQCLLLGIGIGLAVCGLWP